MAPEDKVEFFLTGFKTYLDAYLKEVLATYTKQNPLKINVLCSLSYIIMDRIYLDNGDVYVQFKDKIAQYRLSNFKEDILKKIFYEVKYIVNHAESRN